jgi:ArsR family transcriptional regulator
MPCKVDNPAAETVFKALGHPVRLTLVRRLVRGEHCVCDLVDAAGVGWSTTSRHLEILREAGVVRGDKRGQRVFYRLELDCVADFINCLDGPGPRGRARRPACDCA